MALTQRSRTALYHGLIELIDDDQAVEEMLSYFPTRDDDEPINKEFLRAEMGDLRSELHNGIAALRTEFKGEIAALRTEVHGEIAALRTEFKGEIATLRTEVHGEIAALRTELHGEIAALRVEMHDGFRRMTFAFFGSMISFAGILIGAATVLT